MQLGINPLHFVKAGIGEVPRSYKECIDLVKTAGFSVLDVTLEDRETAQELAAYIEEQGLKVGQSHMPMNRYKAQDYEQFAAAVMKSAENARILGSKILVVHGDEFDFTHMTYSTEAALEFNYRLFTPLVEFAAKNSMKVAFENVFEEVHWGVHYFDPNRPRFCSKVEDLCSLVDRYNSDLVGICWDSGHAQVQYAGQENGSINALKAAGSRVIATHIHDSAKGLDCHLFFPFMVETDWQTFIRTMRQIGYKGDFSYELVYDRIPKALAPDYLSLLRKSGEYILNL